MTAAETLRGHDGEASIVMINGEDRLPYKRTGLTKKLAAGFDCDEFALHPFEWYGENGIDLITSPAVVLNGKNRTVTVESGEVFKAGKILIATGAVPRKIGIPGEEEICHLRRADETEKIRAALKKGDRVLVIGQGVEGVEMAEQLSLSGLSVLSLSSSSRLMSRWLDPFLSRRLADLLAAHGIELLFDRTLLSLTPGEKKILAVRSPEGPEEHAADLVLASIGVQADTALLATPEGKSLLGRGGIRCNSFLQTDWDGVFAAGDVVDVPGGWATGLWHSAEHQGRIAALNMAGVPTEWTNLPVRLKCEVFGDFYFSMAYDLVQSEKDGEEKTLICDDARYLRVFFREGRLRGALMQGMKAFAKPLAKLVVDGGTEEELRESLGKGGFC